MATAPHSHAERDFAILTDPARRLLDITMHGLWSLDTCSRFDRQIRATLSSLPRRGCRIGAQVTLLDMIDFPVQQQASLAALGAMASDASIASRRIAIVTLSPMVRQQVRRIAPGYAIFGDRVTALAWLLDDDAKAA